MVRISIMLHRDDLDSNISLIFTLKNAKHQLTSLYVFDCEQ